MVFAQGEAKKREGCVIRIPFVKGNAFFLQVLQLYKDPDSHFSFPSTIEMGVL